MKIENYIPLSGFYDLRAFQIPVKAFRKLWKIQKFLHKVEADRQAGKIHPQINEIRNFSGEYQQILFSFPIINPDLI